MHAHMRTSRKSAWIHTRRALTVLLLAVTFSSSVGLAAGRNPSRSTAQVLVDLARDVGVMRRGTQTDADALQIRALLLAAQRIDPNNLEAAYWLYELAVLKQETALIRPRLEKLRELDPQNEGVFVRWLELGPAGLKRSEDRRAWLESLLAPERKLSPPFVALVHTELAGLMLERTDRDGARREQQAARDAFPASPAAAMLGMQLLPDDAAAGDFVQAALAALRLNPAQVELAWRIGLVLDDVGLPQDALPFYEHAFGGPIEGSDSRVLAGERWVQLSRNALARGRADVALQFADNAIGRPPESLPGLLTLDWLLTRLGRIEQQKQLVAVIKKRYAVVRDPAEWPMATVNEAAWVSLTIDPQPQRALALAQALIEREPTNEKYQRTLGWALALNKQNDDARRVLTPLAAKDPYAGYRLARLALDEEDAAGAEAIVQKVREQPLNGPLHDLFVSLNLPPTATAPVQAEMAAVKAAVEQFDRQSIDFRRSPGRFLEATVTPDDVSPLVGEPWWVTCTLTNRGTGPVTLGSMGDTNPQLLISLSIEGEKRSAIPNLVSVALERNQVLLPGQTVSIRRTLDIGAARRTIQRFPQTMMRVTLNALLDPVEMSNGEWQAAPGGQVLRPVYFNRLPVSVEMAGLRALTEALNQDGPVRFRALDALAGLLGEQQRAAQGSLGYRVQPVPIEVLRPGLLNSLRSVDWETRARTLDSLQAAGLDAEMLAAARESLKHPHWLVRMMAVRLIARQGQSATEELLPLAEKDADELVRDVARSYLMSWRTTAAPASQPG